MLPIPIAIILCTCVDSWQQARNRFATLFCCIALPCIDPCWLSIATFFLYFRFADTLPPAAKYEALGFVFFPLLARAITLGVKYALYRLSSVFFRV